MCKGVSDLHAYKKERDFLHKQSMLGQEGMILNIKGRLRLGVSRKFFTARAVRYCDLLPRKGVSSLSLEACKDNLYGISEQPGQLKVSLPMGPGLGY